MSKKNKFDEADNWAGAFIISLIIVGTIVCVTYFVMTWLDL